MIKDRIRAALDAEAAHVVPHDHARTDNLRRLARSSRRRRITLPLISAVATAAAVSALVPLFHLASPEQSRRPAASATLPADLDPRYRPTGPVVADRNGGSFWFAGDQLCHRVKTGGGDCERWDIDDGAHVSAVGSYSLSPRTAGPDKTFTWVVYGIADQKITGIRLAEREGFSRSGRKATGATGAIISGPGLRWNIWQVAISFGDKDGPPDLEAMIAHLTSGDTTPTPTPLVKPLPALTRTPSKREQAARNLLIEERQLGPFGPRPLTVGVPLFTYRPRSGGEATMHAYVDGWSGGFGTTESKPASLGGRGHFGGVDSVTEGPDAPWWYGFMAPTMTKVVAELKGGRTLPARTVQVGGHRVFVVRLTGVKPGRPRNSTGKLVAYDAAGKTLGTWKI